MVITQQMMREIKGLAERVMFGKKITESDLRVAVNHVRWLGMVAEADRARSWHEMYTRVFRRKLKLTMPPIGSDLRSITSARVLADLRAEGWTSPGRPSTRPSYCDQPEVKTCRLCPKRYGAGWDCTGRPVRGRWGVSVIDSKSGREVQHEAPPKGKRIRGHYWPDSGPSAHKLLDEPEQEVSSTFSKVAGGGAGPAYA